MQTGLIMVAALAVDALLGEVRRGHPLAAFGRLAVWIESGWNRLSLAAATRRVLGGVALVVLIAPFAAGAAWLAAVPHGWLFEIVLLYLAIGLRSLGDHARVVQAALDRGGLDEARRAVGMMVSRDTTRLDERRVAAATVESVLENGSDAVFGALFWFAVAGAPGVVVHRLVNTLDAMWGYRTPRLEAFGWAAARLDDALNWVPARLTAVTYAVVTAAPMRALVCAWRQGARTESPNAGVVMAAGAGALGVRLGGPGVYHGRLRWRPRFGVGDAPGSDTIRRAVWLVRAGSLLWVALIVLAGWSFA